MSTCRASCAERPGRNPKLHGRKSASKTGSSAIFTADCTIRSRTAGTDDSYCPSCRLRFRYGPLSCFPLRAFDAGLRPGPFPDRAASLLPGSLAITRTGLSPAGDDELLIRS